MSTIEPNTVVEELLPLDDDPVDDLDAFDILDRQSDDSPDLTEFVVEDEDRPPLGRSWAFNFPRRRFELATARGPLPTFGETTLRYWVEKCLNTDRGAHPIHPPDYGIERPFDMLGEPTNALASSDYEERVRDALTFHPRIVDIADFQVEWDPDDEIVFCSFSVVLDTDEALTFTDVTLS